MIKWQIIHEKFHWFGTHLKADIKHNLKKEIIFVPLYRIIGKKSETKEYLYLQIYDENNHRLFSMKLRYDRDTNTLGPVP